MANDEIAMDLLVARADLYAEAMRWDDLLPVARDLVALQPDDPHGWIHLAQALRELGRIREAKAVLLRAEPQHTECAVIHYNLACYDSLLGNIKHARRRLALACEISPEWRTIALCDPDLRALNASAEEEE